MIIKFLKKIYRNFLFFLPKKIGRGILYKQILGKKLNLKNPVDFNEKINYLMVHEYDKKYGVLADKYLVRNYIKSKGFEKNLAKLYGVYNNANNIDFSKLPDKFVLKPNNGCGNIFICKDKNSFDIDKCKKKLNAAMKMDFSKNLLEYHYSYINPKILCEEFLDDGINFQPVDYKFYCFNGKVDCILLCSNREKHLKLDYYDRNWNYLPYAIEKYRSNVVHQKPSKLNEMIGIAEKLSEDFKFVRVDLYEIKGKIYFGELTFTPAAGLVYYNTDEALKYLGSKINLN